MRTKYVAFHSVSILMICFLMISSCKDSEKPSPTPQIIPSYLNSNISYGSVTDIDGNKYATVTIGGQTWMAENLRTTKYRNGDPIPNITDSVSWSVLTSGAQCTYNNSNSTDSISKNGRLYNWFAVTDTRNIAPVGWHLATVDEWKALTVYVSTNFGKSINAAKALASTRGWSSTLATGAVGNSASLNNSTGFSALPCGIRASSGLFDFRSTGGYWWTALEGDANNAWGNYLGSSTNSISGEFGIKQSGLSIRCVKD